MAGWPPSFRSGVTLNCADAGAMRYLLCNAAPEREQSLLIGQTHVGPLLETLSVSLAMSLAFSVSAL